MPLREMPAALCAGIAPPRPVAARSSTRDDANSATWSPSSPHATTPRPRQRGRRQLRLAHVLQLHPRQRAQAARADLGSGCRLPPAPARNSPPTHRRELADKTWLKNNALPQAYPAFIRSTAKAAFSPISGQQGTSIEAHLGMIATGYGITMRPRTSRHATEDPRRPPALDRLRPDRALRRVTAHQPFADSAAIPHDPAGPHPDIARQSAAAAVDAASRPVAPKKPLAPHSAARDKPTSR